MKLPKVPDFLKIPERNELSYSERELEALKIYTYPKELCRNFGSFGYGNFKQMKYKFKSMIETPLPEGSLIYRKDFFDDLMSNLERKKGIEKMVKNLPRSSPIRRDFGGELILDYLEAQRLIELPSTLEYLNNEIGSNEFSKDFHKMFNEFYKNNKDFINLSKEILKKYPIICWETEERKHHHSGRKQKIRRKIKVHENHNKVLKKIYPYLDVYGFGKNIREQFLAYLMFGKILEKGCPPIILGLGNLGGKMDNAIHLNYNSTSPEYIKKSKFGSAVPNNAEWNKDSRLTLITGPNSGGKSVYLRTIGLNTLLAMNGFWPLADSMELSPVRRIWPAFDFGDEKGAGHLETGLKYFRHLAENATTEDLLLMDEPAQGAEPAAEYELAKGNISKIAHLGEFNSFVVTHDIDMMKEFKGKKGATFKRVADYDDEENKYKIMDGLATGGYGIRLAKRIGADPASLEKLILKRKKNGEL